MGFRGSRGGRHGQGVHVHTDHLGILFVHSRDRLRVHLLCARGRAISFELGLRPVHDHNHAHELHRVRYQVLACGIVFELPAATYVSAKLELVDASLLKKYRKHAIVVNTIVAAAITPSPDPFSMLLLAVPLIAMYELSIVIARYVNPTTEVTAHELDRNTGEDDEGDERDESEEDPTVEPEDDGLEDDDDHPENGHERDL